jgi:S1-C subfamily serine protease
LFLLVTGAAAAANGPPPIPSDPSPATAPKACALPLPVLYEKVSPAVVSISSAAIDPYDVAHPIARRSGSGVVVDPSGLVLTNAHVVRHQQVVTVTLDDGTTLPARVLGADAIFDIAFLKVIPKTPLPFAKLGDSDSLRVGEEVVAIGNPFGLDQTLTRGIVSAVNRLLPGATWSLKEPLIQTDAAINPGNSGGPLVDLCGSVVGLTTALLPDAQGIGFAIPVNLVASVTRDLLTNGRVIRPWVGIQGAVVAAPLQELLRTPLPAGLLVEVVEPGSPAEHAGVLGGDLDLVIGGQPLLVGGDVLIAIDGAAVGGPEALADALARLQVGRRVTLTLARAGVSRKVEVTVAERPAGHGEDLDESSEIPVSPDARRRTDASRLAPGTRFVPGGRRAF